MSALAEALALYRANRLDAAEERLRGILAATPADAEALHLLGVVALGRGRAAEAAALMEQAVTHQPTLATAWQNLGVAYTTLGQTAKVARALGRAVALTPDNANLLGKFADALQGIGRAADAVPLYERAIALAPTSPLAFNNLGVALAALNRSEAAIAAYACAIALNPRDAGALSNLASAYRATGRGTEALAAFRQALAIAPDMADTHFNVANLFTQAHRRAEALVHYQAAARLLPNGLHTQREYLYNLLFGCHFDEADRMAAAFRAVVRHHLAAERDWRRIADVVYLSVLVALDDALFPPIFERFAALLPEEPGAMARARAAAPPRPDGRLRIGYLSPNFGNHPVGHVTLSLYGLHDRSRFEVFAFSLEDRAHEAEPFHRQIRAGVDHFEEIGHLSDAAAAAAIRAHGIHILIDLNGCMTPKRLGIPAHRAAPVQVYWLGHAGGVGIPSLDYLLADRVVVPDGEPRRYREAVARLPDCYHVTDRAPIAAAVKPRAAYGLADGAVVFCAFNNPQKIDRAGFGLWMAILRQVPGSQLWLTRNDDPALEANLRRAAEAAGVDPGRLVFATRVADKAEHLARHALADLFLDTVTLTASTTALDALWGGLPLLTLRGSRFAGRIAASMLTAVGLAEMIVDTPERFVAQAVALAGDPARLKGLRARLEHQRNSFPLFDTERFARHLERAFETMWANFQAGRPPQDFDVPAIGAGAVPADLSGVVAVCPGAGHPARAFPPARLADICRWLARDPGVRFVVLGGEAERPFAERLPGALDLTGRLTPAEAAAVIRGCKAVLSMDEAPARLAAAEGTPVVVFTSHPSASDPAYESGKVLLLRPDSALWPCEDGCAAPVPHCIANVQDAEVAERIAAFLSGRPFPPPPPSRAPDSGLSER